MKNILELQSIDLKTNNKYRLKNISLSIKEGEHIALIGPNGSGKTSLISTINGTTYPTSGKILFRGEDIHRINKIKIATIWQDLRLIEELTVNQNVNIGLLGRKNLLWALKNLIGIINDNHNIRYLKAVGIKHELLNTLISNLSGGQKQRVAIARMLVQNADLLLADEPTSNLDFKLSTEIIELLVNKNELPKISIPKTCIVAIHKKDLIHKFNRIIGIKEGSIIIDTDINNYNEERLKEMFQ